MKMDPYDLKTAQDMIRGAIAADDTRHSKWRALETLYRTGSLELAQQAETGRVDLLPELDRQVVNIVLPHINVMLASIVARDPKHLAEPVGGNQEAEDAAKTAEGLVSYFWKRSQGTDALRDATQDMLLLGNGFLKSGWLYDAHEAESDEPEFIQSELEAADMAIEAGFDDEDLADSPAERPVVVDADEPYLEYCSPYDLFVAPQANRMETAPWVCHRVTLPLDEVQSNDQYDSSVEVKADGTESGAINEQHVAEWARQHRDEATWDQNVRALQTATLYEFYDMRARRLMVFQLGSDKPLFDEPLPYAHRYPPFVHIVNYRPNGSTFWGFGDLENVARVQALFNEMISMQVDNARRSGNKYLVHEDAWSDELKAALESDVPDVVAQVKGANGIPLDQLITMVQREGLSGDVWTTKGEFEEYVRKILGINDFQAGGAGADRMSATAAAVVDGIASMRAMDKVASVERGASRAGMLLLLLCQEFLDEPRVIRIAGPDGASWPTVSAEDIRGEYLLSIEGGSTQAVNPQTREQRGMRTLSEVLPLLENYGMDPMPLLRSGLKDLGYDPDLILRPNPNPPQPEGGAPGPEGAGGELDDMSDDEIAAALMGGSGAPAAAGVENGGPPAGLEAQLAGDIAL